MNNEKAIMALTMLAVVALGSIATAPSAMELVEQGGGVVGALVEDDLTLGAGIVDDPVTIASVVAAIGGGIGGIAAGVATGWTPAGILGAIGGALAVL